MRSQASSTCHACRTVGHRMNSKECPLRYARLQSESASTPTQSQPQPASGLELASQITIAEAPLTQLPAEAELPPPTIPTRTPSPPSVLSSSSSLNPAIPLPLRYDDPRAIYQRYVEARYAWQRAQPRGSNKSYQQYRKVMGLPLQYNRASYEWCLDYKRMTKRCTTLTGSRDWTKDEMMAYLDWSRAEDGRVEVQVAQEMEINPFSTGRRGVAEIWKRVDRDIEEQQALYSRER